MTSAQRLAVRAMDFAGTAGAQRRHEASLRIFKMWRYSGRDT